MALYVGGNERIQGIVSRYDISAYSDLSLKTDIRTISNPIDKLLEMRGVSFRWKNDKSGRSHVGVVAQEVEKVLPEVITKSEDNIRSVSYGNMVGLLIECIKENRKEINRLREEIEIITQASLHH